MKTKTKTTVQNNTSPAPEIAGLTARPMVSISQLTTEFLIAQKQKKKNQGENSYVDDVGIALKMLCANYTHQSWSLQDAASLLSHLDISVEEIAPIFNAWVKELQKHDRLKTLLSIYSFPTYAFQ